MNEETQIEKKIDENLNNNLSSKEKMETDINEKKDENNKIDDNINEKNENNKNENNIDIKIELKTENSEIKEKKDDNVNEKNENNKIENDIDKKIELTTENSFKEKKDDIVNEKNENNIDKKIELTTENSFKEKINLKNLGIVKKNYSRCCGIICLTILLIILELAFHFILSVIFIYYKKKHQECEAKLFNKINLILSIYLAMLIIIILIIIFTIITVFNKDKCLKIYTVFYYIVCLTLFALELTNLIIVQIHYNKSKNWDDCGKFKTWAIIWLVLNYISIIGGCLVRCCKNRKKY